MTAPVDPAMAHCARCPHRLGSGCGCECCAWASEAVRVAAQAVCNRRVGEPRPACESCTADARAAVQAALPVIAAAAVAGERERLQPELTRIEHDAIARYERFAAERAKAVEAAVAGERERIAALAEQHSAVRLCTNGDYLPFADLLRGGHG